MTESTKRKMFSGFEKAIISTAAFSLALSALMVLAGTEGTPVQRGLSNLIQGATITEVVYATNNSDTNKQMAERLLLEVGVDDVEIIITDDQRNCALWETGSFGQKHRKVSDEETGQLAQGGCWRESTPDSIYLSTGLTNYESVKFVTLHEYAHVLQHRGDWPKEVDSVGSHEGSNECLADVWAYNHGASANNMFYFNSGICEDYRDMLTEGNSQTGN